MWKLLSMTLCFFEWGGYYFDCIWNQALECAAGQQAILLAFAPPPQDLTMDELVKTTCIDVANLDIANFRYSKFRECDRNIVPYSCCDRKPRTVANYCRIISALGFT